LKKLTAKPISGRIAIVLLAALLSAAGCEKGGKTVSLRFKYEPGMELVYDLTQNNNTQLKIGDSLISRGSSRLTMTLTDSVRRMVDDTTAEMLEKSEYVNRRTEYQVAADSTVNDSVSFSREMVLFVNPNGKVVNIEAAANISESLLDYWRHYAEQGFPVFPAGEHAQGYSWTQSTKVILDENPVEASTTYTLKSFAREQGYDCVVISYEGTMIIPVYASSEDSTLLGGANRIEITGVMYFAYKEGITIVNRDRWTVDGFRKRLVAPTTAGGKKDTNRLVEKEFRFLWEGDGNFVLREARPRS